ncbi:MAG: flagellar hook capping protein [Bacteroidetes bacterium]|nr:flagellar hook capping protein [Bacteroidota bacterium]
MATAINEALLSSYTSTTSTENTVSNTLGKDDFLKLLITQLRYQDPLNPLDGTEFASQLAQFSSLEQLTNMNDSLSESITTTQLMAQSIGNSLASTMIGKDVKASGNALQWTGDGEVEFGYTLQSAAASSTVKIYDAQGLLVRTMSAADTAKGDTTLTWDGKDDDGNTVAAGAYTVSVSAVDASGKAVTASPFLFGTITGVRFTSTGTVFLVDGKEIPVANIIEILNGESNG